MSAQEMSKFYVRTLLLCFLINPICSIVDLKSISSSFPDTPARFTKGLNGGAICGGLWLADPVDACSSLLNEVDYSDDRSATIVLIVRGNCAFDEKVRNAQEAGFQAAIVYDDHNNQKLIAMMGNSEGIWIHAVFVSSIAGEILREHAQGERVECCIISFTDETAWTVLVISIISAVAVISHLTTIFFTFYHWRSHQERRPILGDKAVADLQCVTFNSVDLKGHMGETCAICLEDYKHGENLKVLPCQHDFHAICVDSWLTKWATFCPVCKHDIRIVFLGTSMEVSRCMERDCSPSLLLLVDLRVYSVSVDLS